MKAVKQMELPAIGSLAGVSVMHIESHAKIWINIVHYPLGTDGEGTPKVVPISINGLRFE